MTKNRNSINFFLVRRNVNNFIGKAGLLFLESQVKFYSKLQQQRQDIVKLGFLTFIIKNPITIIGWGLGGYFAYKSSPYIWDNWLWRRISNIVYGAKSTAEVVEQTPENVAQLGQAALELGQTVAEIGVSAAQGTAQIASNVAEDVVIAGSAAGEGALEAGRTALEHTTVGAVNLAVNQGIEQTQNMVEPYWDRIRQAENTKEVLDQVLRSEIIDLKQLGGGEFPKSMRHFLRDRRKFLAIMPNWDESTAQIFKESIIDEQKQMIQNAASHRQTSMEIRFKVLGGLSGLAGIGILAKYAGFF